MVRLAPLSILGAFAFCAIATAQDDSPTQAKQPAPVQQSQGTILKASSAVATTVYCNIPGEPNAVVPGLPGFLFEPGTGTTHFDRPFSSPNGNWILTANTDDPSATNDEILIVNGVVLLKEGNPAPWDALNNMSSFDTTLAINDNGEFAFALATTPTTVNNDYIIKGIPGPSFSVVAQEGGPVTTIAGATYDDALDSVVIDSNGVVGFHADGIDNGPVTTTTDELLELGTSLIGWEGVSSPNLQATMPAEVADNFDVDDFFIDAPGNNYLWQGDLTGSTNTDDVVVLNNNVVLQEGSIIPGSGFVDPIDLSGIVGTAMDAAGNWYARGNNDLTEDDWVVRNGIVVAAVGMPVLPGSTEVWDDTDFSDCFFAHTGNGVGDYLVAGVTSNPSTHNGLIVLNGTQIVCRENDPVDIDNNGAFDDGLYFSTFGNDDFALTDSGCLYFTATLRNAAGTTVGQGFFKSLLAPCNGGPIETYGVGCIGSGPSIPRLQGIGCATPGGPLTVAITEGLPSSTALLFIGVTPLSQSIPGMCTLLTNPLITVVLPLDANGSITLPTTVPVGTPNATVLMQAFNLDPGVSWGFSNTNGLSITIQ